MATIIDGTTGTSIAGAGTVVGNLSVGGNLAVTGNQTVTGNLTVSGDLTTSGGGTATLAAIKSASVDTPTTFQDSAGTQIGTLCRAWANFDGTLTGTITPRGSFNIASIVRTTTGVYAVTMATPMPDANFVVMAIGGANTTASGVPVMQVVGTYTTTNFVVRCFNNASGLIDCNTIFFSVFR